MSLHYRLNLLENFFSNVALTAMLKKKCLLGFFLRFGGDIPFVGTAVVVFWDGRVVSLLRFLFEPVASHGDFAHVAASGSLSLESV